MPGFKFLLFLLALAAAAIFAFALTGPKPAHAGGFNPLSCGGIDFRCDPPYRPGPRMHRGGYRSQGRVIVTVPGTCVRTRVQVDHDAWGRVTGVREWRTPCY